MALVKYLRFSGDAQQLLHALHGISVVAQLATFAAVYYVLHVPLPWGWLLAGTAILAAWGCFCALPAAARPGFVSRLTEPAWLTLQLAVDCLLIAWPLYFSGGGNNPFAFVLLLPVAISAAILPARRSWLLAGLAIGLYSLLVRYHLMLPSAHGHFADQVGSDFNLHVLGMWANFVLSVAVIAGVIGAMAAAIRRGNAALAAAREEQLRNEQLLHIGVLAAGAAHELNTPLATATLLVDGLQGQLKEPSVADDLALLQQQLTACSEQVKALLSREQSGNAETLLVEFLPRVFQRWRITRPDAPAVLDMPDSVQQVVIVNDDGLAQTLVSLLNNAANANIAAKATEPLRLSANRQPPYLQLVIADRGAGLSGEPTEPGDTRGWGLQLARASVERLGGQLNFAPREGGGTQVSVRLPLLSPRATGRAASGVAGG